MFKTHRTYCLTTGVKNNTIAVFCDGVKDTVKVIYHKTIVVDANKKKIKLNNGGWDTISTRTVINRALEELNSDYRLERKRIKKVTTTVLYNRVTEKFHDFNGTIEIKVGKTIV